MTTHVPEGTSEAAIQDMRDREAARARELADSGHLLRLWRPPLQPGEWRSLGLFAAADEADLESVGIDAAESVAYRRRLAVASSSERPFGCDEGVGSPELRAGRE